MTAQDLIAAYRSELARLYGHEIADASVLVYEHGWFYVSLAHWRSDLGDALIRGSLGATKACRRRELEAMLKTLRTRLPEGI